ncbi:MAG: AraC family transcriptional regulator [Saprospiraceae bacterium]|nr:AraC family transcriptional regulator [Saprospiraceae bacterium]
MVCNRCILVVQQELEKLNLAPSKVILGEAKLKKTPSARQMEALTQRLSTLGFELIDNQKHLQIEKIKKLIIEKVQSQHIEEHFSLSEYLGKSLNKDYSNLSRLFSSVEGTTVEQYFILQKLEKVKEWLIYVELTLTEIAWQLGYSSVAHLSSQFKKMTGLPPRRFKEIGGHRTSLDKV